LLRRTLVEVLLLMPLSAITAIVAGRLVVSDDARVLAAGLSAVGWGVFNSLLFVVWEGALTLPHELGHALAGRALGLRVASITVGAGTKLLERRLLGGRFALHAVPFGGFTSVAHTTASLLRLREFLFALAGPAVNFVALGAVLLMVPAMDLRPRLFLQGPAPVLAFVGASIVILLTNLIPRNARSPAGIHPTDGMVLARAPLLRAYEVEERLAARFSLEAEACRREGRLEEAQDWAERGLRIHPNAAILRFDLGFTLALRGDCEAARDQFALALEKRDIAPGLAALARNNIAWADLMTLPQERLEEADRFSQQALEALGWEPALKGTRGAVFVERGLVDEGLILLQGALRDGKTSLHPLAKATYIGYLALGLAAQGKREEALEALETARGFEANCRLLPRVAEVLGVASRDHLARPGGPSARHEP
jgi:tetratricopeptide (TPR) repeat protein